LSFPNFGYIGADWEHFKKAFPGTAMELANGTRRKGPELYFNSDSYYNIGKGGNCFGFSAASAIRYRKLGETIEPSLLSTAHQAITLTAQLPAVVDKNVTPRQSDVKDYLHLYQARQHSYEKGFWNGAHQYDTPLQVYKALKQLTTANQPAIVSIYGLMKSQDTNCQDKRSGHAMTAYRVTEEGNTGFIYVYDSNYPNDSSRRITVDLATGQWSYTLGKNDCDRQDIVWGGLTDLRYTDPAILLSASLWPEDNVNRANAAMTMLGVSGSTAMLITDAQGRKLGYEQGQLVQEIPGASIMESAEFNLDEPNASLHALYFVPNQPYTVTLQPLAASGVYTLTAFGNGSAMQLSNLNIATNTVDTLLLHGSVLSSTFTPATDTAYCQTLTAESSDSSREFVSCINGQAAAPVTFGLTGDSVIIGNASTAPISLTTTIEQVGQEAKTDTITQTVSSGDSAVVTLTQRKVYLPLIVK